MLPGVRRCPVQSRGSDWSRLLHVQGKPGACTPVRSRCPAGNPAPTLVLALLGIMCASAAAAVPCPVGQYSELTGDGGVASACTPCPGGTYGTVGGLCLGNCSAGYACPAGSTNGTAVLCGPGQFSGPGQGACTLCGAGRYAPTAGASNCSRRCSPGYACALGSTNGTAAACPAGRYSAAGAGVCTGCPAGRFGTVSAQSVLAVACPGLCGLGFFCPPGSTSPTAMPCPPGTYTDTFESSRCTLCPAGTPYSGAGATSAGSCLACGPGVVVVAAPNTTRTAGCDSGLVAAFPCPDPDWFPWVSSAGVEPAHSCLRLVQGSGNWSAANATCSALAPGARLLTTQQVAAHSRMDCSLSLLWSCGLVVCGGGGCGMGPHATTAQGCCRVACEALQCVSRGCAYSLLPSLGLGRCCLSTNKPISRLHLDSVTSCPRWSRWQSRHPPSRSRSGLCALRLPHPPCKAGPGWTGPMPVT